ncbi:NAD(P)H-dependent FMN reductase [Pedobacter steynii]|uniref:NAD(P)H-dependent FMN reductase n=1 Tax=Pedobacter steynii TaxID=430522 RepID=A0A1H0GQ78_9SPHI|nr:NAD(P)H-dependent oxidoreductase [Pedobacter steynii]NQX42488.1 NAD(P)H-dependent oxidoreductase [Pedobacter steynii]SDO08962.1 NAD(P)H-dependent FMN reductase [Pedobacter steynii]
MVTIISGTNRPGSNTLKVAKYYQKVLSEKGLEANIFSLEQLPETLISSDLYGKRSQAFEPIQELMTKTSKFLFIIPEYNGSFPGVLKTFIDACQFPESFYDKKAALVGISSGKYGNIRGIDHFGGVCSYLHLNVLPLRIHVSAIKMELNELEDFFKEDTLKFTNQQMDKFIAF